MRDSTWSSSNSDSEKSDRDEMRSMLVPQYLIREMNDNERIGLDFLIDCLENTSACYISAPGTVSTKFDDEVMVSLDVEQTVRKGIRRREDMGDPNFRFDEQPETGLTQHRRLPVSVSSNRGTSQQLHSVCILSIASSEIPFTDDCASFVLSAENGDLTKMSQISDAIKRARNAARREEKEILINTVKEELERVMALSWNEMICEHETHSDDSELREVCADEVREAFLQPDPKLDWTGGLPEPEAIYNRVLSRISWKIWCKLDGRIDTD